MPPRSLQDGLLALEFPEADLSDLDAACLALIELRYLYELQVIYGDIGYEEPSTLRRRVRPRLEPEDRLKVTEVHYGSPFIVDFAIEHWEPLAAAVGGLWIAIQGLPLAWERYRTVGPAIAAKNADNRALEAETRLRAVRAELELDELMRAKSSHLAVARPPDAVDATREEWAAKEALREALTERSLHRLGSFVGPTVVGELVPPGEPRKTPRGESPH